MNSQLWEEKNSTLKQREEGKTYLVKLALPLVLKEKLQ